MYVSGTRQVQSTINVLFLDYTVYRLVHTGERPYQCAVCWKRFSSTSNLKTHQRLHSGEKPFACRDCPSRFTQFVHLKLHRRLHTNERPYECRRCHRRYISASGLKTHTKTNCCTSCTPSTPAASSSASSSSSSSFIGTDDVNMGHTTLTDNFDNDTDVDVTVI
jgi:uncharacterized Zn-finger protein